MIRKIWFICLALALLAFGFAASGCRSASDPLMQASITPSSAPTPTPAPTPQPVIAVFGAADQPEFCAGMAEAADGNAAYELTFIDGGVEALSDYAPAADAVAVLYLAEPPETLPKANVPLFVYDASGAFLRLAQTPAPSADDVPSPSLAAEKTPFPADGVSFLTYDGSYCPLYALEAALAYPPHEAPVRLLGLFSGKESDAYALWQAASDGGRVFDKASYFLSDKQSAADWMTEQLGAFYPGMLDGVYAETAALAVAAVDALAESGRTDMEVFCAAADSFALVGMRAHPDLFVSAFGANLRLAGQTCLGYAEALLSGDSVPNKTLLPDAFTPDSIS